jgi:hypothetical protein
MPRIAVQGYDQVVQERIFIAQTEKRSLGIRGTATSPVGIHESRSQDRIHIHIAAQNGDMEHFAAGKEGKTSAGSQNADKQELAGERRRGKRTFGGHTVEKRERWEGEAVIGEGSDEEAPGEGAATGNGAEQVAGIVQSCAGGVHVQEEVEDEDVAMETGDGDGGVRSLQVVSREERSAMDFSADFPRSRSD